MLRYYRPLGQLPSAVRWMAMVFLVNRLGSMALVYLGLYLTQNLAFSLTHAGWILSLYGAMTMVASLWSGQGADRWGPTLMLRGTLIGAGVLWILFPFLPSGWWIAVYLSVVALGHEGFRPPAMMALNGWVKDDQRSLALALVRLVINMGASVGPVLGGVLVHWSFTSVFWVEGLTCLLAAAVTWTPALQRALQRLDQEQTAVYAQSQTSPTSAASLSWRQGIQDRRLCKFLCAVIPGAVVFFVGHGAGAIYLVKVLGYSPLAYGLIMGLNAFIIIFTELPLVLALSARSLKHLMMVGIVLYGVGHGLLIYGAHPAVLVLAVAVWTLGEIFTMGGLTNYLAAISPTHQRGLYQGLYSTMMGLCSAVGPALSMALLDIWDGEVLWLTTVALSLMSALLMKFWVDGSYHLGGLAQAEVLPSSAMVAETSGG